MSFNTCSSCKEQLKDFSTSFGSTMFQYMLLLRGATRKFGFDVFPLLEFQYMLLLRGATVKVDKDALELLFQYMLLLRGATRTDRRIRALRSFNTCSSCEEQPRDVSPAVHIPRFNTCSSCEEQLVLPLNSVYDGFVSIHAPLARSNNKLLFAGINLSCFNTCSSCEEQLAPLTHCFRTACFNTCSSCEEQLGAYFAGKTRERSFNTCSSCEEQQVDLL